MALMGDSIDNIPGARDPNDKPAPGNAASRASAKWSARTNPEIWVRREGSEARRGSETRQLSRSAAEKRQTRVAEQGTGEDRQDVPITLDLHKLKRREPNLKLLAALYRELGFNSLLKELGIGE